MSQNGAGAPLGNQNATKGKRWQKALERALARAAGGDVDAGLAKVADAVVKAAMGEGGPDSREAWKEIGDRMDGKAPQDVNASVNGSLSFYQGVSIPVPVHEREPDPMDSAGGPAA